MQLEVLRYFLEVAKHGSVRKAAEQVNITPSAVSRHIAILERVIGAKLFERRARGMVLTHAGEVLQKYAQPTVGNFDIVKAAIGEIRGLQRGAVRVFAIEIAAASVLYPAIREFLSEHENVSFEVEVVTRDNSDVVHALLRDEAQIGIMYKLRPNADIEQIAEFATPFAVIASPKHKLAKRKQLSVRDLAGTAIAGLTPSNATRRLTEDALRSTRTQFDYALAANSIEMAKEFAKTGMGVTVLPAIAARVEAAEGSLVAIPLSDWNLRQVRTALCFRRGRVPSPAATAFAALLKARFGAL